MIDFHQAIFQRHHLFHSSLRCNPTLTFVGVAFDVTLLFYTCIFCQKPSYFPFSKLYTVSLLSHAAASRSPILFYTKLFFGPFSLIPHPDGFLFSVLPRWNALTEWPVAQTPSASRPSSVHLLRGVPTFPLNHPNSPRHAISSAGSLSASLLHSFRFLGNPSSPGETLCLLIRSCFLLPPWRISLLAFYRLLGTCLLST